MRVLFFCGIVLCFLGCNTASTSHPAQGNASHDAATPRGPSQRDGAPAEAKKAGPEGGAPAKLSGQGSVKQWPEGFVLVKRSADLHASPSSESPRGRDSWGTRYHKRLGPYWVFRYVGARGDWVEVETVGSLSSADHCYGAASGLATVKLRLFVRSQDVVRVTTKNVRVDYGESSHVVLRAGVGVVREAPDGPWLAQVSGVSIQALLNETDTGYTYAPSPRLGGEGQTGKVLTGPTRLEMGKGLLLLGEKAPQDKILALVNSSPRMDGTPVRQQVGVTHIDSSKGEDEVTVSGRCFEAKGRVPEGGAGDRQTGGSGVLAGLGHASQRAKKGVTVYWPDGTVAGTTIRDVPLRYPSAKQGGEKTKLCFHQPLRVRFSAPAKLAEGTFLPLCFDADNVSGKAGLGLDDVLFSPGLFDSVKRPASGLSGGGL